MDWDRAIDINKAALTRIVAALVALLGDTKLLPQPVYRAIVRVLHPAESAVRRLIVVAARGLVVPLPSPRTMPPGLVFASKGTGRCLAFQLFDTRKTFRDEDQSPAQSGPRIRTVGDPDPRSLFLAMFPLQRMKREAETLRLSRRLEAVKRALANLSREAKRMAQWRARRATLKGHVFTTPLRPGPPPGRRKNGKDEIDSVLRECHSLAWDVLSQDTS